MIEAVLDKYGNMSGDELSELTHNELPWQHARAGIPEGQNSNRNVDEKVIRDYYLINSDVYNEMEDNMLFHLAEEREKNSSDSIPLSEVMSMCGMSEEDLL